MYSKEEFFILLIGYGVFFALSLFLLLVQAIKTNSIIKTLQKEKQDLLNRLMAKDFQDYAHGDRVLYPRASKEVSVEDALGITKEEKEAEKEIADRLAVD